jgi:hypothetical protein
MLKPTKIMPFRRLTDVAREMIHVRMMDLIGFSRAKPHQTYGIHVFIEYTICCGPVIPNSGIQWSGALDPSLTSAHAMRPPHR